MTPAVSIIIPAYNVESYIRQCLQSILDQEDCSFEIVLIDDCSTDRTLSIARDLLAGTASASIIALSENIGQARARNLGVDKAKGEFVAFLDSDDFYSSPNALQIWHDHAVKLDTDMLRCNFNRVNKGGKFLSSGPGFGLGEPKLIENADEFPQIVNITTCWQFLYRRKFLNEHGIRFSSLLRQREDRLFFTEALLRARRIGIILDIFVQHRIHPKSTMRRVTLDQLAQFAVHIEELNKLLATIPAARSPLFLRENLGFYYGAVLGYWRPLFRQAVSSREGGMPAEILKLIDALGDANWGAGTLASFRYLDGDSDRAERIREFDADFLKILARRKEYQLFCDVVAGRRITPDEILRAKLIGTPEDEACVCRYLGFTRHTKFRGLLDPQKTVTQKQFKIVLHCGMPKTGSSSLQAHFESNRFRLLRQRNIYYPITGCERGRGYRRNRTAGHAKLFNNLLNGNGYLLNELYAELELLGEKVESVVLSCENILSHRFWAGEETLNKIAAAFSGHEIIPVVFFRSQAEWLESMYVELLSNPNNEIDHQPDEFVEWQEKFGFLDYEATIGMFLKVFGSGCRFLPYRGKSSVDVVSRFYDAVGIKSFRHPNPVPPEMRNMSASPQAALLVRELKAANIPAKARARILADISSTNSASESRQTGRLISIGILENIIRRYRSGNLRVEKDFLGAGGLDLGDVLRIPPVTLDGLVIPARTALEGMTARTGIKREIVALTKDFYGFARRAFIRFWRPIVARLVRG